MGYTISYTLAQILMIHSQDTAHSVHNTLLQLGVGSCGGWVKAGYSGIYIPASGYSRDTVYILLFLRYSEEYTRIQ